MESPLFYPLGPEGPAYLRCPEIAPYFRKLAREHSEAPADSASAVEYNEEARKLAALFGMNLEGDDLDSPAADYEAEFEKLDYEELLEKTRLESQAAKDHEERRAAGEFDLPEDEDPYDPDDIDETEEELAADRLHWLQQVLRDRLVERGYVPVSISGEGILPGQQEAFDWLAERPEEVLRQLRAAIFQSFEHFYADDFWRQAAGLEGAQTVEDLDGKYRFISIEAPKVEAEVLVVQAEARWEDDHGLYEILTKGKDPMWSTADGLYEILPPEREQVAEPSLYEQLVNALMDGKTKEADRLVRAGANINSVPPDEEPPLCLAVQQEDPQFVARLLKYGADPSLREPENRLTPLMLVRRMRKDMAFGMDMGTGLLGKLSSALDRESRKYMKTLDEIEKQLLSARRKR